MVAREGGDSLGTVPSPCSGCFAKAAATLGASHAELSTCEAKAGSSRGQAAIIIKPTSVNIA